MTRVATDPHVARVSGDRRAGPESMNRGASRWGRPSVVRPLAMVAGLLLLLTYLLVESRSPDQRSRVQLQEALQALQLHDAELNRDVLMARAGLLPNYDSLPRIAASLHRDLQILRSESGALTGKGAGKIVEDVAALDTALQLKLSQVEYLKSDNALLRNSLAYFTQIMPRLGARNGAFVSDVALLSHLMLRFVQAPEASARNEAEVALQRLSRSGLTERDLRPLTVHGELVLDVLPRVDSLLQQILAAPTTSRVEELQQSVLGYARQSEIRAQRFRVLLYVVGVLLLGYLLYLFARLRANARELRRKEMQLIQANKMTSLGTLVSSVAHEINNPNQLVLMNSEVLAAAWDDAAVILDSHADAADLFLGGLPYPEMRAAAPRMIGEMQEGARRIDRIIGDLKDFARPGQRVAKTTFELNQVVQRALRLLGHVIQRRTDRFRVELAQDLPQLYGNPQQIEQIVVNLVMNALEALPDRKSAVTVATRVDTAAGNVFLEVRDEGVGIRPEHVRQLTEPFFTTKEATGGTGLGLAIASSLVRLHKGRLTFASEPTRQTRVTVELPIHSDTELSSDPIAVERG
jgi:signal transduction histidine kinase